MISKAAMVIVTTSFPILDDGSESAGSFVSDLAQVLARDIPVRVVAPGPRSGSDTWKDDIEVFRFAAPEKPLSTLRPWNPVDLLAIYRVLKAGLIATRAAVEAGHTGQILALWALPSGHWARRVSLESGIPYSVWTLGSDIWTLGRIPMVRAHLRRVLQDAHARYSDGLRLAEDTRRIADREVGFLPSTRRIEGKRTVPLKSSPPYRFLYLGRWHRNKGVDLLFDALDLLTDKDWQRIQAIEIYGGGPQDRLVKQRIAALRNANRPVDVGGYLDKSAAEKAILRADYLLIPSRIESIPVIFSDAMKLGCPVIATPVGDLPQLIRERRVGITAEHAHAAAYTQAIVTALKTPASKFTMGVDQAAEMFSLNAVTKRLLEVAQQSCVDEPSSAKREH